MLVLITPVYGGSFNFSPLMFSTVEVIVQVFAFFNFFALIVKSCVSLDGTFDVVDGADTVSITYR